MLFATGPLLGQGGAMQIAVFHPGTQHSRQVALALDQLGRLAFLATGLFTAGPARSLPLPAALCAAIERERARFAFPPLERARVRTFALTELPERLASRAGRHDLARWLDTRGNALMGRRIAGIAAREGPLGLWGFDGSSFAAFADPRTSGMPRILDRTIAHGEHWNAELALLRESHGDWLDPSVRPWSEPRLARDQSEYAHATHILCGSRFAARTLHRHAAVPGLADKLHVLPYPFDKELFGGAGEPQAASAREPVRFLFVGEVGVRKGMHLLLDAIARLPSSDAALTVAGPQAVPDSVLAPFAGRVRFTGPVPRASIPALMRAHHVLVLPSLFEGSAIVLPEAMASGLALIHTEASGEGASGESGIVLPRPDAAALAEAMARLCAGRDLLQSMRVAAWRESAGRSFAVYRDRIGALLPRLGL